MSSFQVLEDTLPQLESPNLLQTYFIQLGSSHCQQGVKIQYLDVMGVLFCEGLLPLVIEEGCEYRDEDLRNTWLKFFRTTIHYMKMGYETEARNGSSNTAVEQHLYVKNYSRRISSASDHQCTASTKAQTYKKARAPIELTDPDAIEVLASEEQGHDSSLELSQQQKR